MLHIIRSNSPFNVLILFIFALVVHLQALLHPVAPVALPSYPGYNVVLDICNWIFRSSAFAFTLFAAILLFGQALYLNAIVNRHKLHSKATYVPAFVYIVLTGLYIPFGYFSNMLLVTWCLLLSFDVMLSFMLPLHPGKHIFNAAFLAGLGILFQFSSIFLLLLIFVALLFMRSFSIGEWIIAILGFTTIFYFFAGVLFLTDGLHLLRQWALLDVSLPKKIPHPMFAAGILSGLVILTACGLAVMQSQMPKSTIYVRRSAGVIISCLCAAIAVALLAQKNTVATWLVAMPALSLIIAPPLYLEKSRMFSNFILYFSLLLLVFGQLAIHK